MLISLVVSLGLPDFLGGTMKRTNNDFYGFAEIHLACCAKKYFLYRLLTSYTYIHLLIHTFFGGGGRGMGAELEIGSWSLKHFHAFQYDCSCIQFLSVE